MGDEYFSNEISRWEKQWSQYQSNDFENLYDLWVKKAFEGIPPKTRKLFFNRLDTWLFHTHALIQGTAFQNEARERIITSGKIFNSSISDVKDMKLLNLSQLTYLAQQQATKGKVYSFAQGGLTGTGGWLLLGLDFPAMMAMNLRGIQLIGMTFGHEMNHPYELLLSLKVFHAATLPKRLQKAAWEELKQEVKSQSYHPYVFEEEDGLTDESWIGQPLKQCFKSLFILMFRKKLIQGLPMISMAIGAGLNYQLTKQVTEYAIRFYQNRHLIAQSTE
ncbi:EcsC family protein [Bacillaceae bacterium S4-13-56]